MSEPETKRPRVGDEVLEITPKPAASGDLQTARTHGIAPIKKEYLLDRPVAVVASYADEDEGNERPADDGPKKKRGQNKARSFVHPRDPVGLCEQIKLTGDRSSCKYGSECRFEHDLEKYLGSKRVDLDGACPVYAVLGFCPSGVKCRWLGSHWTGSMVVDESKKAANTSHELNRVSPEKQSLLQRKKVDLSLSDRIIDELDQISSRKDNSRDDEKTGAKDESQKEENIEKSQKEESKDESQEESKDESQEESKDESQEESKDENQEKDNKLDNAASYTSVLYKPTEKKKIYRHRAKILSPLTTVGNLPFRRLAKEYGCDVTYGEMALALPLIQGSKAEWALARCHSSEAGGFGVQIAAAQPWQGIKASQTVAEFAPATSEINLNCGCPLDLLCRRGAGAALTENPGRLTRMLHGMNAVTGDIPVTLKLRTGPRQSRKTARHVIERVINEAGVASVTLHGRTKEQRYTKQADWDYIREVADMVKAQREDEDSGSLASIIKPWIIGNGDVYSWKDWHDCIEQSGVDSVMVARGALIKPWIFEEIDACQYLDKSATERLDMLKRFAHLGLEHWGSDEYGVSTTRRYLLELMSFTHRYVPVGLLEYLPPRINDRPPPWQGRSELETLLASTDYRDWVKISEMFLGPVHDGFDFKPKHKSNSYA